MTDALAVAAVQFRSGRALGDNLRRHCDYIRCCAAGGARVVAFPECSLTGFSPAVIAKATAAELAEAEAALAAAAQEAGAYAVVGMPTRQGPSTFNSAVVVAPDGRVLERYHKIQRAGEKWATPGDHLSVFPVDGVLCSLLICHDERYPELVRLPVLAGARVVFYLSCESDLTHEHKMVPYRAQIVARAAENNVYVVHANAPAAKRGLGGSHGQSRIIRPDGNLLTEASIFAEEVVSATLDLRQATGGFAQRSLRCPLLSAWWETGTSKVLRVKAG